MFQHSFAVDFCTENVATPLVLEGSAMPLISLRRREVSGLPEVYSAALNAAQR